MIKLVLSCYAKSMIFRWDIELHLLYRQRDIFRMIHLEKFRLCYLMNFLKDFLWCSNCKIRSQGSVSSIFPSRRSLKSMISALIAEGQAWHKKNGRDRQDSLWSWRFYYPLPLGPYFKLTTFWLRESYITRSTLQESSPFLEGRRHLCSHSSPWHQVIFGSQMPGSAAQCGSEDTLGWFAAE